MAYIVPNNLVDQYNAGQRAADPSKIDENFNYVTDALDTVSVAAAEGTSGLAQIATQAIAEAATDDSNKFLNALKGKYLVQSLLNAVGNLGTSKALTAPVAWADHITGGTYYVPANAGNTGGPSTDAYHLIVCHYGDSDVSQLAVPALTTAYPQWRVKIGGTWSDWKPFVPGGTQFATSSSAAATADKTALLTGFILSTGARVFVTFSNTNTVSGALTLNVNSTGAKSIYNELGAVSATNPATFTAGVPIEFIYDGTNWAYRKYQDEFAKVVGGAPMYTARAWVNFNGVATTPTIRASGNVSSITDNGVGDYTINFTIALPDTNYAVVVSGQPSTDFIPVPYIRDATNAIYSTTAVRLRGAGWNGSAFVASDLPIFNVAVYR